MTAVEWAALITALGIGTVLRDVTGALWKWLSGRVGRQTDAVARERARAEEAVGEMDKLDKKLDRETMLRRVAMEYAANLRRDQIERCGAPPDEIRPWPAALIE